MKILKFGGSSIADAQCIKNVSIIIQKEYQVADLAIVISALGGVTNQLIILAETAAKSKNIDTLLKNLEDHHKKILNNLGIQNVDFQNQFNNYFYELRSDLNFLSDQQAINVKALDKILSFGERLSCTIIAQYLSNQNCPAEILDARDVILTDNNFGNAYVYYQKSYDRIRTYYNSKDKLQIITGFLGATESGETTTLGRSGSDYSAAIFGAALNASDIEIWTDVNGLLSADPSIVKNAKSIPHLTYEEAMELAHAGAKVIFPPTMIPALFKSIPIRIKNTFEPDNAGTAITKARLIDKNFAVGISSLYNVSLIRFQGAGMIGRYGVIGRVFHALAKKKINIILVSQVFSEHSICFAIQPTEVDLAESLLKEEFLFELENHFIDTINIENNLSLIAVVGEGMRHTPGISGKLFSVLGRKNVNVIAIAQGSSERNISFIIKNDEVKK